MRPEIEDLWHRALRTLETARLVADSDPDSAASRAYYAAYYGVSALFVFEGKTFRRHSGVEAAVHRDLVKAGRWPTDLGAAFSDLAKMRATADYGSLVHLTGEEARDAITKAERVLGAVRKASPEPLPETAP